MGYKRILLSLLIDFRIVLRWMGANSCLEGRKMHSYVGYTWLVVKELKLPEPLPVFLVGT